MFMRSPLTRDRRCPEGFIPPALLTPATKVPTGPGLKSSARRAPVLAVAHRATMEMGYFFGEVGRMDHRQGLDLGDQLAIFPRLKALSPDRVLALFPFRASPQVARSLRLPQAGRGAGSHDPASIARCI